MLKKFLYKCFGINNEEKNSETICFNSIKKLIVIETAEKLPDIFDKWKIIGFIDKANHICENILGDTYEFVILNPNEIPDYTKKYVKYQVNMFNKKTRKILNRFSFHFKYEATLIGMIVIIKPLKNEVISSNHWNFIESLFYNMGFQIKTKYHKNN